jgi:redox-sensitive bicupin YhaK (pirin superfamily)
VRLKSGESVELPQPEGWTALLVVLAGTVMLNGEHVLREKQAATLSTEGTKVVIEANSDAKLLLLAGEPLDEPVVGYGPFVMNSQQEIIQAIADFNQGKFGQMD